MNESRFSNLSGINRSRFGGALNKTKKDDEPIELEV